MTAEAGPVPTLKPPHTPRRSETNDCGRIEAFSDGVFAIASTLLILEVRVPEIDSASLGQLWRALADLWPSYIAFVLSFGTILVMWVNHHNAIRTLCGTSNAFLYANGLLLLTVTFVPFPTAVLARYIETDLASVAVVFYAGSSVLTSLAFLVWFGAMLKPVRLLPPEFSQARIRKVWIQSGSGLVGYLTTAIVGWWWPHVGLGLIIALFVLWIAMSIEDRHPS